MKILLSAYACEPGLGSEEGVGWDMALAIAQYNEVWVLTRTFCRAAIESELRLHLNPNIQFVYFEPMGWSEDWKNTQGAVQLHYYLWQIQAYFKGKELHQQIQFDVIHHVTYVKYWSPSFLSLLPVPFIWGPVGGGEAAPNSFWKDFSLRGKLYEMLRILAQRIGEKDPFTRMTAQNSYLVFATSEETARRLRYLKAKNIRTLSNVSLSETDIKQLSSYLQPTDNVIRFVSVGRLLHWKGFHLGLRAFAAAQIPNSEYWFFGDGPERKRLELLTEKLQVTHKVKFWGTVPRKEILLKLEKCHILVHPSLHDSGGLVCSEMMAAGRPVICLDLGGPSIQINKDTGIKIPAHNPEQVINELMGAMIQLASDSELRNQMGQAGRRRVKEHFSWKVKGQLFSNLYKESLKEIRVAWIYPAIPFGAYWQPVINEFIKLLKNSNFYTGCPWKGFNPKDPKNAAFRIIGKAKYIASANNLQGYNRAFIYASPTIIKPLLKTRPQIIFASAFSIWTVLALLLKPIGRWQVIIIYDGSSPNSDFQDSFWRTFVRKLMVKATDAFVANSKAAKSYLIKGLNAPENNVYSTTYLVPDTETLMQSLNSAEPINLELKHPTFLFVGQLILRKGIYTLLKACSILQKYGYKNYSILIVGNGENREELLDFANRNNLHKQIIWAGWVEYGKLGSYFQRADIFVFPTFEDVWGMAALEAMVFGMPILCSKNANASELVIPGVNGYIFDPEDPHELANNMRHFIDHPELLTQMGQHSQELIADHTPESAAHKLYEITLSVLNK